MEWQREGTQARELAVGSPDRTRCRVCPWDLLEEMFWKEAQGRV